MKVAPPSGHALAVTDAKRAARHEIERRQEELLELSHRIHAHPEVGYQEERACAWVADALAAAGFQVQRGAFDLPTAILAVAGQGPLHVGICAEYDALPGIGHACGHNIIASAAVGAGIGAASVAEAAGLTVTVIGTPAEEMAGAGGKIVLLERGAFAGLHAAMMVHPAPYEMVTPRMIAAVLFDVHYSGKAAHAAAFPEQGINAADALTVAQVAVGLLRQHLPPTARVHGIVTSGGDAPNVVPAQASARYIVRSETLTELEAIRGRVLRCFEAGATATGATLSLVGGDQPYAEVRHHPDIAAAYQRNAEALGRTFPELDEAGTRFAASTDMGNVSHAVPSIHPTIGIESLPAVNHQPEFAAHCITPAADRAVLDGAIALAWTAIDLASEGRLRDRLLGSRAAQDTRP